MVSFEEVKRKHSALTQSIQPHLVMGTVNVAMNGPRKSSWSTLAKRSYVFLPVSHSASFIPEYKLEHTKIPRFMLFHFGLARLIWDWIILFLVAYLSFMIPFNVAFKLYDGFKWLVVDIAVELMFIADIVVNFRTTYIDKKSGRIISQQKQIALNYLKGWFALDLLATIPFELLYFVDDSWGHTVALLRIGRLVRLVRVARRISRYIEKTVSLLGLFMLSFALLGHWFACVWYAIGYRELKSGNRDGWLYELGDQIGQPYSNTSLAAGPSYGEAYISSLYFILTSLTTVGFGNIAPNTMAEKIFSVVVLLLGAIMQSAIFGNITAVIQKLYAVRARFHARATEIKQFVKLHRIEGDLKRRIEDYFLTTWSASKGVDTNEMLKGFPVELRSDICLQMYSNFINLPCFADISRGCSRALSLKIQRAYFGPGELILKEGDAVNAVFFVNSGTIEIVQRKCIVAILGSGDLFGEDISTKLPIRKSNGDVRALTYCDLLYLARDNFHDVMYLYPDFTETFSRHLEMTFNLGTHESGYSTGTGLESIEEGEEERSEDSSESDPSDEDNGEEHRLLKSPKLPLWQRRLRDMEKERKKILADETIELEERTKATDLNKTCENNKLEEDNVTATVNGTDCIASKGSEPQPYTELKDNVGKYNAKDTIKRDGSVAFRRSASYRNRQRHSESDEISRRYQSNNDIDSITATAKSDNDCASFEEAKICRSRRKQNVVPPNSYSDISLQGINAIDGTCMANANSLPRNLFHSGQSTGISPYFSSSLCLMSDSPSQKAVVSESLPECNVIENLMELTDPSQFDNTDFNRSVEQESDVKAGDPTRQCRRGRMRRMGMTHPCIPFTVSLSQSISGDKERLLLKSQSEGGPINDDKGEFTPGINNRLETASTNGSLEGDEKRNFTNESCHSYNEACIQASAEDGWANNTIGPNGETFSNEDSLDDNEHAHYLTKDRYSFSLTSQRRRKVMGAVSNADNSNIVFHADMEPSPVNSELSQQQSYSSNIQKHNRQISTEDVSGYITSSVSPERTMSLSSNDEYGALSDVKLRLKKSISDAKEALESMDSRFEHLNNDVNNLKLDVEVLSDLLHKLLKKSDETST